VQLRTCTCTALTLSASWVLWGGSPQSMATLGSKENPIPRAAFAEKWLPIMQEQQANPLSTFQKTTPVLILPPPPNQVQPTMEVTLEVTPEYQAFLSNEGTGQTFVEAMSNAHGKALIMNTFTPSLELYPKDEEHCAEVFDMEALMSAEHVVPETSVADLAAFLQKHLLQARPIVPFGGLDANAIAQCMTAYRAYLGREGMPWRIGYNKDDRSVVAVKMTRELLSQLLLSLGRIVPYNGEALYREESYSPFYQFVEGDYVLMDIDQTSDEFKVDKDGIPLVRTVNGVAFEATYRLAPIGTYVNSIPREMFAKVLLPIMQAKVTDPASRYVKVAPTLVLYPNADELDANGDPLKTWAAAGQGTMDYQVAADLQTMLQTKSGQTFTEAMLKTQGKALLLNFCTPFLEVYPKDKKHCAMIYDMAQVDAAAVPESSIADLAVYIQRSLINANPLTPYTALQADKVAKAMVDYRKALGRDGIPWRMAFNKTDITAVACQLGHAEISQVLTALGRTQPYNGEQLYRAETFDQHYAWNEGDYVLMDVDPVTNGFKYDKTGLPLVRTVNGTAFECTYNCVLSRS